MRIKEDGSVGIGIASPEAVLHVKDTSNDSATTSAESVSYATQKVQVKNSSSMSLYTGSISGGIYQQVANYNGGSQYPLCLNPYGGKVAIGGTSPLSPLHIRGNNCRLLIADSSENDADTNNFNCGIAFVDNTYDGTTTYAGNPAAGMGFFIGHLSGGSKEVNVKNLTGELSFGTRNVHQAMYINNDGAVGVGNASPDEKLHVNGNILTNNSRFNSVRKTVNLAYNSTTTVHTMSSGDCGLLFAISAIGSGQHFGVMIFQWTSGRSSASTHTIFNSGYPTFTSNGTNIWIKHTDSNQATLSTDIRILKF
jgi:hypothetical protein